MADIKVLMVAEGDRFNFGPAQANVNDPNYFGISELVASLRNNVTPTIQVDTAHRRGNTYKAPHAPDCSAGLTYAGDFLFTSVDLNQYDVLWLFGDEGLNGGGGGPADSEITDPEKIVIAQFMEDGGGVFAVGDHDGIGALMCGKLPRIRTMRKWFEWDQPQTDPVSGQQFITNWSVGGDATSPGFPGLTDRFDTLQHDSADTSHFYFYDQSDPTPQTLKTQAGANYPGGGMVHPLLQGPGGVTITKFPDHMHEGEATDLASISPTMTPFNPNDGSSNPTQLPFQDSHGNTVHFIEFPKVVGFQPTPSVIVYGQDSGHATILDSSTYPATAPKTRGLISVYDGRAVGIGRIVTGSTFHHYIDKNLIGDPQTQSTMMGVGPTGSNSGLSGTVLTAMGHYYVNIVTWLARQSPAFHFVTTKNTFGHDEASNGESFANAFALQLDGFPPAVAGSLMPALAGTFHSIGITFTQGAAVSTANRTLYPFTISNIPAGQFPGPGMPPKTFVLEASVTVNGQTFGAEALFELVASADPNFHNVAGSNPFYLSQELRVFRFAPDLSSPPFVSWPGNPYTYIQNLLTHLQTNFPSDAGGNPLNTLSQPGDLQNASSVTPTTMSGGSAHTNYNFAVVRVRLKAGGGMPSNANGVKVFFRLFNTSTFDTDYWQTTTYPSTPDGMGLPGTPLPGTDQSTFPMYATSSSGGGDYTAGGPNNQNLSASGSAESWAWFGCYLDVYGNPAVTLIGTHHCLVAEIAYDGAPILNPPGIAVSPENSDKLAQRNIEVTPSGNPTGPAGAPDPAGARLAAERANRGARRHAGGYPDELMIDWGNTPKGSEASIYWPRASAADVVHLSLRLYSSDDLRIIDDHTVGLTVSSRLSYVPIPFDAGPNLASLFTIDLPVGVKAGQEFHVVVRRLSTRRVEKINVKVTALPEDLVGTGSRKRRAVVQRDLERAWRYVVGSYQLTIPVEHEDVLLWPEENTLAIMKWRLQQTSPNNRWYPVLKRYVDYLIGRVDAFGGDGGSIVPSPSGVAPGTTKGGGLTGGGSVVEYTGKVCELIFDCFGDVEGFVLETCSGSHRFQTRERGAARLLLRALRHSLTLSVFVGHHHRIHKLIVRC